MDIEDLPGLDERMAYAAEKLYQKRKLELDLKAQKNALLNRKKSPLQTSTINWRDFDINLDFNLDNEEIKQFVYALEKNPNMLFKSENYETKPNKNHPSFRSRILFVFHVAEEWYLVEESPHLALEHSNFVKDQ